MQKNLIFQRNIEIRSNASGLASDYNSNNLNWIIGENPNTACKLWLILFGILLFPAEVFRWAGLELKVMVFRCKGRFFNVFFIECTSFCFRHIFLMIIVGTKHTPGNALNFYFKEEGNNVVPADILFIFIQIQDFFQAFHHSLYKLELLVAHHFKPMLLYFKPMKNCTSWLD